MKKILALIMALTMIFTLAITASAVNVIIPGNTTGGTTTGESMVAYKVLDATISGTAYSYTIAATNPFYGVISNGKYFETPELITGTNTYNVTPKADFDDNKAKDLAAELMAVTDKGTYSTATYDATADTYTFSGLSVGYYLIVDSLGEALIVDTVTAGENGTLTLNRKNQYPSLKKEIIKNGTAVDATDVAIGEVITFRITITLPENIKPAHIEIHDVMDEHFVYIEETRNDFGDYEGFEPNDSCCTLHWDIMDSRDVAPLIGGVAVIEYTAMLGNTVNSLGEEYTNTAWMRYDTFTSTEDTVKVYTYGFYLNKVNEQGTLMGAEFILSRSETDPVQETNVFDNFILFNGDSGVITAGASANSGPEARALATFTAGSTDVIGLAAGTYYLHETKAPEGYNKLTAPIKIVIAKDGSVTADGKPVANKNLIVENKSGSELPETGGIGTTLFYVIGTLMMTGAAVLMITKKRMSV